MPATCARVIARQRGEVTQWRGDSSQAEALLTVDLCQVERVAPAPWSCAAATRTYPKSTNVLRGSHTPRGSFGLSYVIHALECSVYLQVNALSIGRGFSGSTHVCRPVLSVVDDQSQCCFTVFHRVSSCIIV